MTRFLRRALELGYRHIDTAIMYENESLIGESLQEIFEEGKFSRKDIFLVSKFFSDKSKDTRTVLK